MGMSPDDVIKLARESGAEVLDLKFIDFPGLWQHFSVPIKALTPSLFETVSVSTVRRSADGRR